MSLLAFLLYPFSILYDLLTRIRNMLFDQGVLKSIHSQIPSVSVGNLSVGGTGKTPMVEYLIELLKDNKRLATLSRGYGRKTKGFLKAETGTNPEEIGDEPFQIFEKYGDEISVFVCENRVQGVVQITSQRNVPQLLILDDAFQHRYIMADFSILLTTYSKPFFRDFLLPSGRLRESRVGAKRADLIIVTKCKPELEDREKEKYQNQIRKYSGQKTKVLFSEIGYGNPVPVQSGKRFSGSVVLLSGVADNEPLVSFVRKNYHLLEVIRYKDHHNYTVSDMDDIKKVCRKYEVEEPVLLTTEKDVAKVKSIAPEGFLREIPIFVLPIRMKFSSEDQHVLNQLIQQKVLQKTCSGE